MGKHESTRPRRLQRERSRHTESDSRRRRMTGRSPERRSGAPKAILLSLLGLGAVAGIACCVLILGGAHGDEGSSQPSPETTIIRTAMGYAHVPSAQPQATSSTPEVQTLSPAPEPQMTNAPLPQEEAPVSPPPAPAKAPSFSSEAEAQDYIRRQLIACPESITFRLAGASDVTLCDNAAEIISAQPGTQCTRGEMLGDFITLFIKYGDDALILAHHQGRIEASRLTELQRRLYSKARDIVRDARRSASGDYELARVLHDWIVLNSQYSKSIHPDGELASILLHGEGLCDCYSRTYYLLASMAGLECRYVVGTADDLPHSWNLIRLRGTWVHVDCTYDDPLPDRPGKTVHFYFGLGDDTISKSHQWKRSDYPACPTNDLWYAYHNLPHYATVDEMAAELVTRAKEQRGTFSLDGYVEELARHPGRESELVRAAVRKYRVSLGIQSSTRKISTGFITLSIQADKD